MSRWLRVLRGIVGTGISFAIALSGLFALLHAAKWMLIGSGPSLRYLLVETILTGTAPVGFLIGASFAGALALTSRGRSLRELSAPYFALLGAVVGFVLSLVLVTNTSPDLLQTVVDGTFFALIGGGAAAGTHVIATRGSEVLSAKRSVDALGDGRGA